MVTLHTEAPHEFTEDDLTLVAPIAALVAASVETAQLYAERRRQLDAVRTLASAVDDLGSAAARRRALHGLAESARALLGRRRGAARDARCPRPLTASAPSRARGAASSGSPTPRCSTRSPAGCGC